MAIIKILEERKENVTLALHPNVVYVSGTEGISGSMPLRARPSTAIKSIVAEDIFLFAADIIGGKRPSTPFNVADFDLYTNLAQANIEREVGRLLGLGINIHPYIESYMKNGHQASVPASSTKKIPITRFDPPFIYNRFAGKKATIQKSLMPFYEPRYDLCKMEYSNYHTLNFLSAPASGPAVGKPERLPDDSAIIYQNFGKDGKNLGELYSPEDAFSFNFYINPRYTNERIGVATFSDYPVGTLMHLSSTFAISLLSGTARDQSDLVNGYRLMLQLSHSADIPPREVDIESVDAGTNTYPNDLIFITDDNALSRNEWQNVTIRWGSSIFNGGTGSIDIDNTSSKQFIVPSSTISPETPGKGLFIGNYYEGHDDVGKFFNMNASIDEGLYPTIDYGAGSNVDPVSFVMRHPLNAEVHELKMFSKYITREEIDAFSQTSLSSFDNLMFYVPPMFNYFAHQNNKKLLITPQAYVVTGNLHPFNPEYSMSVGGLNMNLFAHTLDFARSCQPRHYNLTASNTSELATRTAAGGNEYLHASGSSKKLNLTVLPNDNGLFKPDYQLFMRANRQRTFSASNASPRANTLATIPLEPMAPQRRAEKFTVNSAYIKSFTPDFTTVTAFAHAPSSESVEEVQKVGDSSKLEEQLQPAKVDADGEVTYVPTALMTKPAGSTEGTVFKKDSEPIFTIAARNHDVSSREVCVFDISNIYYGNNILENSFYIEDTSLTGSDGKVKITLKDNGRGGLVRCDSATEHANWANVGNIFYNEGIAFIKSPPLSYFGKDKFQVKFKGSQNTHIKVLNIHLPAGMFNSSSNPNYEILSSSNSPADGDERFVYIDGINIHDENLNVIMRTNFAQPVKKKISDSLVVRVKMDF